MYLNFFYKIIFLIIFFLFLIIFGVPNGALIPSNLFLFQLFLFSSFENQILDAPCEVL